MFNENADEYWQNKSRCLQSAFICRWFGSLRRGEGLEQWHWMTRHPLLRPQVGLPRSQQFEIAYLADEPYTNLKHVTPSHCSHTNWAYSCLLCGYSWLLHVSSLMPTPKQDSMWVSEPISKPFIQVQDPTLGNSRSTKLFRYICMTYSVAHDTSPLT